MNANVKKNVHVLAKLLPHANLHADVKDQKQDLPSLHLIVVDVKELADVKNSTDY